MHVRTSRIALYLQCKKIKHFNVMKNYRVSSFLISVKLEKTDGQYMLIHGYTGAIDIVEGCVVEHLRTFGKKASNDHQISSDTINALISRGYLTDKTQDEEYRHVSHLAEVMHQRDKKMYKKFTFLVTYNCNFRCPYCYESPISAGGNCWSKQVFTKEMVDRLYDSLLEISPRELHNKRITLYGGEPLLTENKEIVSYIVNIGTKLGYTFDAVTNGYDLEAYTDLLSPDKIAFLQITLDGCKNTHDSRRIHYIAGKSFDKIVKNIGLALEKGVFVKVRVNTDLNNFGDLVQLKCLFSELGYDKYEYFKVESALLRPNENTENDNRFKLINAGEFAAKHGDNSYLVECQDYGVMRKLEYSIRTRQLLPLTSTYCAGQSRGYVFDPLGDIYACWEVVGRKDAVLGNYSGNKIEWYETAKLWHGRNISNAPSCYHCKYAFLCGGGCLAKANTTERGFGSSFCNQYPIIFKYAANRAYQKTL